MRSEPPLLGEWLLLWSGASDALIGDLHEAFLAHRSRTWYWRQVLAAVRIGVLRSAAQHKLRTARTAIGAAVVLWAFAVTLAGRPTVDVATGVAVDIESAGWFEAESPVAGQTKLVPGVVIRLLNRSNERLPALQVNAVFHRGDDEQEWGAAFRRAAGSAGLAPGRTTGELLLPSPQGYTGTQHPRALLTNSRFVDARVDLFVKYSSAPWTRIGRYAIPRSLVTP